MRINKYSLGTFSKVKERQNSTETDKFSCNNNSYILLTWKYKVGGESSSAQNNKRETIVACSKLVDQESPENETADRRKRGQKNYL